MTPDWPSLWKREPGLKPEGLTPADSYTGQPSMQAVSWDEGVEQTFLPSESLIAALCRDRAARWLADQAWYAVKELDGWHFHSWIGYAWGDTGPFPDYDAALFAACKAKLDARVPA